MPIPEQDAEALLYCNVNAQFWPMPSPALGRSRWNQVETTKKRSPTLKRLRKRLGAKRACCRSNPCHNQ